MSELRVDTINEATSGTGTTISKLTNPNQPFRNKIINGDFQIFQRGASAVTAPSSLTSYVSADRWLTQFSTDGAMTLEQSSLSLADKATTGVANALEIKCTTADTSIAAGQFALLLQSIEAQFLQDLGYGTNSAKTLTVSFYVKSNVTGTFCITVLKGDTTAAYLPIEYTINSADTWERKTITMSPNAGSTSLITGSGGVINNDNGVGIQLIFNLAMGSNFTGGTNNTWSTSTHFATSNQSNFLSSTSNNFHLTGVQLEVGETATDFEHLPRDVQLDRCMRYAYVHNNNADSFQMLLFLGATRGGTTKSFYIQHPRPMRDTPSITLSGEIRMINIGQAEHVDADDTLTVGGVTPSIVGQNADEKGCNIFFSGSISGMTDTGNTGYILMFQKETDNKLTFDAEL